MSNPNRVLAGIPEGGQFSEAAKSRPQALAELSASLAVANDDDMDFDDDLDRFSAREDIGLDRLSGPTGTRQPSSSLTKTGSASVESA